MSSPSIADDVPSSITIDVSPPLFTAADLSTDPICRICRCDESDPSALLSPCLCSGSLAHVHPTCLQEWITLRPSTLAAEDEALSTSLPASSLPTSSLTCELCHTPYAITFTSQPLPFSCNRHLFPLLLDITAHIFFFIVSSYLILSFPPSTLPSFVKPLLFVVLTVFALISLHLSVKRWRKSRSTLVIAPVEREVKPEVVVESGRNKEWSEHLLEQGDSECVKERWLSISSLPTEPNTPTAD